MDARIENGGEVLEAQDQGEGTRLASVTCYGKCAPIAKPTSQWVVEMLLFVRIWVKNQENNLAPSNIIGVRLDFQDARIGVGLSQAAIERNVDVSATQADG